MRKPNNPKDFEKFLHSNGYDINKLEFLGKDCTDYKVRNIETGKIGFIRY
jgi:hypothetical protein